MKKFLTGVNEVNRELEGLKGVLGEMDQLTRKVSGAANEQETQALRRSLGELREDFIDGMNITKNGIENLKIKAQEGKTAHEKHIKEQHVKSLIERTKKLVEHFSTSQAEFGAEERHRLKSQYIIAKPTATKEELEQVEYSDSPDPFMMSKSAKPEAQQRKQSLKQISTGIQQVNQMTEQLNLLVHKSDRNVDKISVTTRTTEVKAKKADKDLKQALKYQKLARLAKLIALAALLFLGLLLLLMVLGGIIFLVIVLARNFSPQSLTGNTTGDTAGDTGTGTGTGTNTTNIETAGGETDEATGDEATGDEATGGETGGGAVAALRVASRISKKILANPITGRAQKTGRRPRVR